MKYEIKEYSFGELIGNSFNLYFSNFFPLVIVSLLATIPYLLFYYFFYDNLIPENYMDMSTDSALPLMKAEDIISNMVPFKSINLSMIISYFLVIIVYTHAFVFSVNYLASKYFDSPLSIIQALFRDLLVTVKLVGLFILISLMFMSPGLIVFFILWKALAVSFEISILVGGLITIPILLIGWIFLFHSPFALIIEKLGPIKAIKRGLAITKNNRFKLFALLIIIYVAMSLLSFIISMTYMMSVIYSTLTEGITKPDAESMMIFTLALLLVSALTYPLGYCAGIASYFSFRVTNEGDFSLQQIVDSFKNADNLADKHL